MAITSLQGVIIKLLMDGGESYGLDLVGKSKGMLKRGSIYVLLDRMEDSGYIKSRMKAPPKGKQGPARRVYRVTGVGMRALEEMLIQRDSFNSLFGME